MIGPLALLFGIVLAALWTPWVWQRLRRAVHILQLEEYDNARALRWAARSWLPDRAPVAVVAVTLAFAALLVTTLAERGLATILTAAGVFALLGLVLPLRFRARPEKKPLAVTMRVRRLFGALAIVFLLLGLLLALLIWLGGLPGGAALLIAPALVWLAVALGPLAAAAANLLALPVEAAIKRRYRNEAIGRLRQINPKIVAVTGSFGKTTTKELVAAILSARYRVLKTPQSYNTVMGITRVVREQLKDDCEVFVVEMGMYGPGEIRELCRFVGGPDAAAIVGVNEQHLERTGSIENTMRAKYEIVEGTKSGGLAVFNMDNAPCAQLAERASDGRLRVVRVGTRDGLDLWADKITVTPKLMRFDVHDGANAVTVRTRLLGRHLVPNFLIALALGKELGIDLKTAAAKLTALAPVGHRLAVSEVDGTLVIDDAYSSNVDGARAALALLAELPAQRRFVVTPGIVELGSVEAARNREFGAQAAKVVDTLFVVGDRPGSYVREGALAAGLAPEHAIACESFAVAQAQLRALTRPGDAILFENDLPDNYA
jgi:UDP-N-acetylmuramoyl-tripeptide--D-alanyl-D-alanine ligase